VAQALAELVRQRPGALCWDAHVGDHREEEGERVVVDELVGVPVRGELRERGVLQLAGQCVAVGKKGACDGLRVR